MKSSMKKQNILPLLSLLTLPHFANAQGFQVIITNFLSFLDRVIIPAILTIAFLMFVINVVRFFIMDNESKDGKKNAKNLAIYGVGAFVLIIIFWGIANIFIETFDLGGCTQPMSDYQEYNLVGPPPPNPC